MSLSQIAGRERSPFAYTYSIVARDPDTGQLGVAVQSHYFSVGPIVPWAEAGVGAVATQSLVKVDYGPEGVALMRDGRTAREALDTLLAQDESREVRQVAMVDAHGNVATHTGSRCIPAAGHATGDSFSVQANLMLNDTVWPAMKAAYESAEGDLADRFIAALEAAEAEGGDIRGRQSAAILIVSGERQEKPWQGRIFDLRVEDHPQPVDELKRLVRLRRAYIKTDEGDELVAQGRFEEAARAYEESAELAPEIVELQFWVATGLVAGGRLDEALPLFREVFRREPVWAELVPRLVPAGLLPDHPTTIDRIVRQAEADI